MGKKLPPCDLIAVIIKRIALLNRLFFQKIFLQTVISRRTSHGK
jgi:hypothetical protein|nr:MAG TPA: hypothetical protein [Caudoviricetes sp.]